MFRVDALFIWCCSLGGIGVIVLNSSRVLVGEMFFGFLVLSSMFNV